MPGPLLVSALAVSDNLDQGGPAGAPWVGSGSTIIQLSAIFGVASVRATQSQPRIGMGNLGWGYILRMTATKT